MTPTGIALLIATVFGALFVGAYAFLAIVYVRLVRHWTPIGSEVRAVEQREIQDDKPPAVASHLTPSPPAAPPTPS